MTKPGAPSGCVVRRNARCNAPMCIPVPRSASIETRSRNPRPRTHGRLAQLVARFLHTEEVISSSLVSPTTTRNGPRNHPGAVSRRGSVADHAREVRGAVRPGR